MASLCTQVGLWALALAWTPSALAAPVDVGAGLEQVVMRPEAQSGITTRTRRELHGRFLQITDFHPDRFYKVYASTAEDAACHRGKGPAGVYGAEISECDSPISLVNKTMEWVRREYRDSIDFVIWTGDSARHDNDEDVPRSADQVLALNEMMVTKMFEAFGRDDNDDNPLNDFVVPIIPTFGNNDILPHNIMTEGPNRWTRAYTHIWRQFIPEEQTHAFELGGWFYVEVIPNKLAVFSLNTLYFFAKNAGTYGCANRKEPGHRQMEWLRIQLQFMRDRNMKVLMMGHVPPVRTEGKSNWDETCWQKYTLWMRQYRDIIVGSMYGHFNNDHFMLQDFEDLKKGTLRGRMPEEYATVGQTLEGGHLHNNEGDGGEVHAQAGASYFIDLRNYWKSLFWLEEQVATDDLDASKKSKKNRKHKKKKHGGQDFEDVIGGPLAERFAASFVSASIVPNLYPAFRVYEYNVSGLDEATWDGIEVQAPARVVDDGQIDEVDEDEANGAQWNGIEEEFDEEDDYDDDDDDDTVDLDTARKSKKKHKKHKKHHKKHGKHKKRSYKFTVPDPPSSTTPPGPAYSPQLFTLTGYKQFLANLTEINGDFSRPAPKDDSDEAAQDSAAGEEGDGEGVGAQKWKHPGGHNPHKRPHGDKSTKPHPKDFHFETHYETWKDGVYDLRDLTVRSLVDLAKRIAAYEPIATTGTEVDGVEDGNALESVDADEDEELETAGKNKKKKKSKHDKEKKKREDKRRKDQEKRNRPWFAFVQRAFVETLDEETLKEEFGQ